MKTTTQPLTYILLLTAYSFSSCSNNAAPEKNNPIVTTNNSAPNIPAAPQFNEDSAYSFVKAQVDFGPRVPGTAAHAKCAVYLMEKLKSYGWETQLQTGKITTYDGNIFNLKNIIASYKPDITNRILLLSHWDTRPFADQDSSNKNTPSDGADDGGSGVAVLLEIARQISIAKPEVGIDILLDDLEDYGSQGGDEDTWCLGTQYWAKNPHVPGYVAQYGILLDMVGAKGATFPKEGVSMKYASYVVKKIWDKAANLGYSNYFIPEEGGAVTDDNYFIISDANIPCVDIINMNPKTGSFGFYHHTHSDNINIIDKQTLKSVGQTILEVVWEEQKPKV